MANFYKGLEMKKSYFNGIKVGDKVWHFEYGWGKVIKILKASELDKQNVYEYNDFYVLEVVFDNPYFQGSYYFDLNGITFYSNSNQILFWDEVKFNVPQKKEY